MAVLVFLVLFLALPGHSSASYCICKDGVDDKSLQKTLDYACGAGADCLPIHEKGACYDPNTVKDHCNYAVNSYYQRKGQAQGTCDFSGTATLSQTAPTTASSCVYPSSPSNAGTSPTTPSTTTPGTSTTPSSSTTTPSTNPTIFGVSPTGSSSINDNTGDAIALHRGSNLPIYIAVITFCFPLMWL